MKSRIDTYTVRRADLEKTLGHKVSAIYPMLSDKPTDWSDVPIIEKPWHSWYLSWGMEYLILTWAHDRQLHFVKDKKLRHGLYSQYPD